MMQPVHGTGLCDRPKGRVGANLAARPADDGSCIHLLNDPRRSMRVANAWREKRAGLAQCGPGLAKRAGLAQCAHAWRVLLARGRDGTLVFVPPIPALDETLEHLTAAGFRSVDDVQSGRDGIRRPSPG